MRKRFFLLFFLLFLTLNCITCMEKQTQRVETRPRHVVNLIGIDGIDWSIIDLMIRNNELPTFKYLKEQGSWGYLATLMPTESVSIWNSIATGVVPTRHQIQTFMRRIPGTDEWIATPSTNRARPALWNIVSDAGKSVVSVKWFSTWPAEKVNGAMVSTRLEPDSGGFETYPPELFKEISDFRFQSVMDQLPQPPKPKKNLSAPLQAPGMILSKNQSSTPMFDDSSVWLAGKYTKDKYNPDLFMIYFKSTDKVQHYLWGAHTNSLAPDASDTDKAEAEAIFGLYRYFDTILSEIIRDKNQTSLILSDHGFEPAEAASKNKSMHDISMDRVLSQLGFLIKSNAKTDWSQTQAYEYRAWPSDLQYAINVNLKDREPDGIVESSQKDSLIEKIKSELIALSTKNHIPVFTILPKRTSGADLMIEMNHLVTKEDIICFKSAEIPANQLCDSKALPRGVHINAPPGVIIAYGSGIAKNKQIMNASVLDITPTVLYLLGLPAAKDFDGKILRDLFTDDHIKSNPMNYVETYGIREVQETFQKSDDDEKTRKELKSLGYL